MEIRVSFSLLFSFSPPLVLAVAFLLLPLRLFSFSPLCGHHFPHCLAAVLIIVLFKARGSRSIRQTRWAEKGGFSHPTGTEVSPEGRGRSECWHRQTWGCRGRRRGGGVQREGAEVASCGGWWARAVVVTGLSRRRRRSCPPPFLAYYSGWWEVAVADEDSQNEHTARCSFSNIPGGSPSCSSPYLLPTNKPPKSIVRQPTDLETG